MAKTKEATRNEPRTADNHLAQFIYLKPNEKGEIRLPPNLHYLRKSSKLLEILEEKSWKLVKYNYQTLEDSKTHVYNKSQFIESATLEEIERLSSSQSTLSFNSSSGNKSSQKSNTAKSNATKRKAPTKSSSSSSKKKKKEESEEEIEYESEEDLNDLILDDSDNEELKPKIYNTRSRQKTKPNNTDTTSSCENSPPKTCTMETEPPKKTSNSTKSTSNPVSKSATTIKTSTTKTLPTKTIDSFFKSAPKKKQEEPTEKDEDEKKTTPRKFNRATRSATPEKSSSPTIVNTISESPKKLTEPPKTEGLIDFSQFMNTSSRVSQSPFSPSKNLTNKRVISNK